MQTKIMYGIQSLEDKSRLAYGPCAKQGCGLYERRPANGKIQVSESPGFGVDLNEEFLKSTFTVN